MNLEPPEYAVCVFGSELLRSDEREHLLFMYVELKVG
jgi:hypothetical protein